MKHISQTLDDDVPALKQAIGSHLNRHTNSAEKEKGDL